MEKVLKSLTFEKKNISKSYRGVFIKKTLYTMNRIVEDVIDGVRSELLQMKYGFMKSVRVDLGNYLKKK